MEYIRRHKEQVMTASGLGVLAAIWLIISPWFLPHYVPIARANDVILGVIIGVLALIRFMGAYEAAVLSEINVLLGVWVLISPWVLHYHQPVPFWNNIIVGIVVIALAGWSALATTARYRGGYERGGPAL
jgi:hypothetical protein